VSLLLSFVSRRWEITAILVILVAIHPAWTISASSGDCGVLKSDISFVFSASACYALIWQVVGMVWSRMNSKLFKRESQHIRFRVLTFVLVALLLCLSAPLWHSLKGVFSDWLVPPDK